MEAKLFVTDYASYNNGTQFEFGKWWDLSDYSDAEEFLDAVYAYFKENNINDPELMYTDYENFFKSLYGESMSEKEIQRIYDTAEIYQAIEEGDVNTITQMHNTMCEILGYADDTIYSFDEDFFDMLGDDKMSIAQKTVFGDVNWSDDFIRFDGYGNFETLNDYEVRNIIDEYQLLEAFDKDPSAFTNLV